MTENRKHLDLNDNENTNGMQLIEFRGKSVALNAYSKNEKRLKNDLRTQIKNTERGYHFVRGQLSNYCIVLYTRN